MPLQVGVWLPYVLYIISGLSFLGVMVKVGTFKVCKQVLFVNKWVTCGPDQMAESLNAGLMLTTLSFLEGRSPVSTINIKKFLREQFCFSSNCPLCVLASVSNYLYGSVEVYSLLKLLLYLFQEGPFNDKLSFQKRGSTKDTTDVVK